LRNLGKLADAKHAPSPLLGFEERVMAV